MKSEQFDKSCSCSFYIYSLRESIKSWLRNTIKLYYKESDTGGVEKKQENTCAKVSFLIEF